MNYDLSRFHNAQRGSYETALREIRAGHKRSHWIWYIFPQIQGLGYSSTAQYYAIADLGEAKAYLADPVLRERLKEMLDDMYKRKIDMADEIFVINVGGYIGSSTRSEIEYATATGKAVRYLEENNT